MIDIASLKQILLLGFLAEDASKVQLKVSEALTPCEFTFINKIDDYLSQIKKFTPDIIISNHDPTFDGLLALKVAKENFSLIPFIFLCNLDDVQTAVEFMKNGASDIILWRDIEKIPLIVSKLIAQKQDKFKLQEKEKLLFKKLERFEQLAELSHLPISIIDSKGRYIYLNPKFRELFGYTLEDIPTGKEWFERAYPDDEHRDIALSAWISDLEKFSTYQVRPRIFKVMCKDGSEKYILFMPVAIKDGEQIIIYEDITERKKAEEALKKSEQELKRQNELMTSLIMKSEWFSQDLNTSIRRILEISSELIQTERVSVWRYCEDLSKIECIGLYERSKKNIVQVKSL